MSDDPSEGDERELERWLRDLPPEQPEPLRREEARLAFLRGRSRALAADRMGSVLHEGRHGGDGDDGQESDGFLAWLVRHGEAPPASAAFRGRARLAFLSALAAGPRPERRSSRPFRVGVLLAAAAAAVVVTYFLPEPEGWRVRLDGPARFDEEEYGRDEGGRLAVALESSGTLEARTVVHASLPSQLELELQPGGALTFPSLPELDGLAPFDFELAHGEVFVCTRPDYAGNPIRIRTGEAEVVLHGTTVGVRADERGTCVCVAEGSAQVTSVAFAGAVGPRATVLVPRASSARVQSTPFPGDDDPESAHTRPLLEFLAER